MKVTNCIIPFMAFALLTTACSKDDQQDTTKPNIKLNAPVLDAQLVVGGEIYFEAEFSDDVELNRYKIDIHDAGDHIHSKTSSEWTFLKEADISGKKNHHVREQFQIPADANLGEYHFVVFCTDRAGNETRVFTDIILIE